jgi:hypothetical protein
MNKNDHNVYILGAGFSTEAGIPLVRGFLNKTRDCQEWLIERGRKREADAIESILEFRLKAASAAERMHIDLENIEELFSLATASRGDHLSDETILSIAATIEYAQSKITPRTRNVTLMADQNPTPRAHWTPGSHMKIDDKSGRSYEIPIYDALVGLMCGYVSGDSKATNTIISFNYDLVVEGALSKLGLDFGYGFANKAADYKVQAGQGREGATKLLKIHGSVNWAYPGQVGKSLTVFPSMTEVLADKLVPFLVPPSWKKQFIESLTGIWDSAVNAIAHATRIVVIGYSMPTSDTHFKYLIAAGLQRNASLRSITVIDNNPKKDQVESRLYQTIRQELSERGIARIHAGPATDVWDNEHLRSNLGRDFAMPYTTRRS